MSSSLARTRSLRKPTQGSSTDLPPTTTTTSVSSSASITAARGPASSTTGAAAPSASTSHRPVSPSRLPAPRSLAATRPTTRTVSGASVASSTAAAATTASEAPKKKRPNPLSSLLSRSSSTRQPASATTSTSTRQRDVAAGAGAGGGSASSGPTSAPLSRTSALSGLTRTSSTREPGLSRTRYPANASTSNLSLVSSSNAAAARAGAGSGPSTPTTARPTTSGGLPSSRRAGAPATTSTTTTAAAATGSPTKGHARARSVATLNSSTVLRPLSQTSSTGAAAAPRSRPTSLYGAPPTSSYTNSSASTTTRPRPPSATDRLSSKPSVSSLSSATTTTSTRTARAGSTTTAPPRLSLKQPHKPPSQSQQASQPPHLAARQQAQQRHPSPTSPPRTTKPVLRPAFSTLQQHYSPAKSLAPKPLTATYLAAPSPSKLPANIALTAETARLQTELLQLHLLHRDLPQVTSQWHATARSKLAARHADLAASARGLATLESDAAEHRNIAALRNWGATPSTGGKTSFLPLEDRIQRLDALLTSLWSLDSPGGKHHRLVRAFERWASSLADLEAARARAEDGADPSALLDDNADVRFGGGLDARWKDDAAALVRRLEGWDAQLRELEYRGDDDEDVAAGAGTDTTTQASSLKRMLDGCASLVKDMLDELAVMEDIEAAAVERENEWIKRMNREGDDGRGRDTQRAGAIWRVI
ncbi:hypothetical protein CaCOL14_006455 [Colletotrichum acutatum]